MINIDKVRTTVNGLWRKNQIGNYMDTTMFNNLAEKSQLEYFNKRKNVYDANKSVSADLESLKSVSQLSVPSDGFVVLPIDWWITDSITSKYFFMLRGVQTSKDVTIEGLNENQFDVRIAGEAFYPDKEFPIYTIAGSQIEVAPKNLQMINFKYLRYPILPLWGFDELIQIFLNEASISTRDGELANLNN
jgi:hypothetical protein